MSRLTPFLTILFVLTGCTLFGGHWDVARECDEKELPGFFAATCSRQIARVVYADFRFGGQVFRIPYPVRQVVEASYVYADATSLELLTASATINGVKRDPVVMGSGDPRELLAICSDPYNVAHGNPLCVDADLASLLRAMPEGE